MKAFQALSILFCTISTISLNACTNSPITQATIENEIRENSYPPPPIIEPTTYPAPIENFIPSEKSIYPTITANPIYTPLIIASVKNENGVEIITLQNISNSPQDLKIFTIVEPNSQKYKQFDSEILLPGQTFDIINGTKTQNLSPNQIWLSEPIINIDYDQLYLLNEAGRIIWTFTKLP